MPSLQETFGDLTEQQKKDIANNYIIGNYSKDEADMVDEAIRQGILPPVDQLVPTAGKFRTGVEHINKGAVNFGNMFQETAAEVMQSLGLLDNVMGLENEQASRQWLDDAKQRVSDKREKWENSYYGRQFQTPEIPLPFTDANIPSIGLDDAAQYAPFLIPGPGTAKGGMTLKNLWPNMKATGKFGLGMGGAMGFLQNTSEQGLAPRFFNAGAGAVGGGTAGMLVPPVLFGAKKGIDLTKSIGKGVGNQLARGAKALTGKLGADDALTGLRPQDYAAAKIPKPQAQQDVKKIIDVARSAQKQGVNLTPAEASGSNIAAAKQGMAGYTDDAAAYLEKQHYGVRPGQEKQAITNFLDDVSPNAEPGAGAGRKALKEGIDEAQSKLSQKVRPLYESVEKEIVPDELFDDLMQNKTLSNAYQRVLKKDIYADELAGLNKKSYKVLDLVKRDLDDLQQSALRRGDKNAARLYGNQLKNLTNKLDDYNATYGQARAAYQEGVPAIQELTEGNVQRLAKMKDHQLKSFTKSLFDPADVGLSEMTKARKIIQGKDPALWNRLIRNEMERQYEAASKEGIEKAGSTFFRKNLQNQRQFKMWMSALQGNPKAQGALENLRKAFTNLIDKESIKGTAGKARSSLNVVRSSAQYVSEKLEEWTGGRNDMAFAQIVTDPDTWIPMLKKIHNIKDQPTRLEALGNLLKSAADKADDIAAKAADGPLQAAPVVGAAADASIKEEPNQ